MLTLAESVAITGKPVNDYLPAELDVPQVDRIAAQGDVLVVLAPSGTATAAMPRTVVVVASEASSNTHTLHPNGECFYDRRETASPADLVIGILTVPDSSTALLSHQEHGNLEILPGTYEIRRQREYQGEWAYVCD